MAFLNSGGHLIFSPPLEAKLISICDREGLVDLTDGYWSSYKKHNGKQRINAADRSHLLASVFLHPSIKLRAGHESQIALRSDLIALRQDAKFNFDAQCEDVPLLLSYCKAADTKLTDAEVTRLTKEWVAAYDAAIGAWGAMPSSDGNGNPCLLGDFVAAIVSRSQRPQYTQHQLDTYNRFRKVDGAAAVVSRCSQDLNSIWSRKASGDAIAVHPRLQQTYRHVLSADDFADGLTETDLFFLSVRALRTLPVGRTLKETLELSATAEGVALRQRLVELNDEYQAGGLAAIPRILERIERDADDYRSLTSHLESSHTLSNASDVALSAAGLIPMVGTLFGGVALLKSSFATYSSLEDNKKLKEMLWAKYQGRSY